MAIPTARLRGGTLSGSRLLRNRRVHRCPRWRAPRVNRPISPSASACSAGRSCRVCISTRWGATALRQDRPQDPDAVGHRASGDGGTRRRRSRTRACSGRVRPGTEPGLARGLRLILLDPCLAEVGEDHVGRLLADLSSASPRRRRRHASARAGSADLPARAAGPPSDGFGKGANQAAITLGMDAMSTKMKKFR